MIKYVLSRVALMIPLLFMVVFVVFAILNIIPGDPARLILGIDATPAELQDFTAHFGLDKPFFERFVNYIGGVIFRFDFGISYRTFTPVVGGILSRLPVSMTIAYLGIFTSILLGIPLGVLSAIKRSTIIDPAITVYAMFLSAIPAFWLAMMLLWLFGLTLGLLPTYGASTWRHFILPIFCVGFLGSAGYIRSTRVYMLDTVNQEYIKTARAKGAPEYSVIWRHAFKNACLPLINSTGLQLAASMGGTVLVENVFTINGMGTYALQALQGRDMPVVMCNVIFFSIIFMLMVLIIDILYAVIDPRIRAKYID